MSSCASSYSADYLCETVSSFVFRLFFAECLKYQNARPPAGRYKHEGLLSCKLTARNVTALGLFPEEAPAVPAVPTQQQPQPGALPATKAL